MSEPFLGPNIRRRFVKEIIGLATLAVYVDMSPRRPRLPKSDFANSTARRFLVFFSRPGRQHRPFGPYFLLGPLAPAIVVAADLLTFAGLLSLARQVMVTRTKFYGAACALVFLGIMTACLWPFHSPRNQVAWLKQGNGVRLGGYATIVSRGAVTPSDRPAQDAWTLEMWLRPGRTYQSGTILAFYNPERPRGFLLRQWNTDLVAESSLWSKEDEDDDVGAQAFFATGIFRRSHTIFLTLASGPQGTSLYIDGKLLRVVRQFRLSADDLSGQLVVANSPVDNDRWSGELRGLAFYSCELPDADVLRHYATWTQTGRPDVPQDDGLAALYLFNEKSGSVIHNQVLSGANLYIPERYLEVHQAFLKRPWNEYRPDRHYWKGVLLNVAGFVPLGFLLYAYLSLALHVRRGALITILIGGLLSLTMEILQAFIPTRDSGMTDIITNTLGTAAGAALCRWTSIVCESLSDSRHAQVRRLAGLLTRHGQEERLTVPERA
jgi:VanZ family protein